jgi:hypothetical protein
MATKICSCFTQMSPTMSEPKVTPEDGAEMQMTKPETLRALANALRFLDAIDMDGYEGIDAASIIRAAADRIETMQTDLRRLRGIEMAVVQALAHILEHGDDRGAGELARMAADRIEELKTALHNAQVDRDVARGQLAAADKAADDRWCKALELADWDGGVFHYDGGIYPWPRGFVPDCPMTWEEKLAPLRQELAAERARAAALSAELAMYKTALESQNRSLDDAVAEATAVERYGTEAALSQASDAGESIENSAKALWEYVLAHSLDGRVQLHPSGSGSVSGEGET